MFEAMMNDPSLLATYCLSTVVGLVVFWGAVRHWSRRSRDGEK